MKALPTWAFWALGAVGLGLLWAWNRDSRASKAINRALAAPTSPADVRQGWRPTALQVVRPKRWGFVGCGTNRSTRQWMAPDPWRGRKSGNLHQLGSWTVWGWPRAKSHPALPTYWRCKGPDQVSSWMPLDWNDTVGPNDWGPDVGLADVEFLDSQPYVGSDESAVVDGCVVLGDDVFVPTTGTVNLARVRVKSESGATGELRVSNSGRWMATDARGADLPNPRFYVVLDDGTWLKTDPANDPRGAAGVGPTVGGRTYDPAAVQGKATTPLWAPVFVNRAVGRGPRVMVGGVV